MAKKSKKVMCERRKTGLLNALKAGKKPRFPTKAYNRCGLCGRKGGYINRFDLCRICLRQLASKGLIMGLKKASW